jgi:uncharacterized membrane protein
VAALAENAGATSGLIVAADKARPHRLFLFIAPFLYAAYALLTPQFQTPDEHQHLFRAWQISSLRFIGERRGWQSGGELPPSLGEATLRETGTVEPWVAGEVHRRPFFEIFGVNTPARSDQKPIYYDFPGSIVYSPVGYVPQAIAIRTGQAAGLSIEWTLRLGRLLNAALCIALVSWALRLLPFGRWIMVTVALSPPMAAGAASFGQDALVNGGGFLLTALGLKIAVEERWSGPRAAAVGLIGAAVSLAKFAYLPLVAITAFPVPRDIAPRRWLLPPLLVGSIVALLIYLWMRFNAHAVANPFRPWLPTFSEQVAWATAHPLDFSLLLGRTWLSVPSNWARLYVFGDSTVPIIWTAAIPGTAALLAVMAYGDREAPDLTRSRRIWMIAIAAAVALLIMIAIFVAVGTRGATVIENIEARYFLPVLPLAAIALMRRGEATPPAIRPTALILVLIAHAATLGTIITTFYSF